MLFRSTITATYKLNKKSTKLTCKVTVKSDTATDPVVTSAPVVTTAPVTTAPAATKAPVTASPVVDPTAKPTAKPTNTPRPSATPSPTPMPIGEATFDDVTNAVKLDLSTFAKAEGSGAYDATNNRVTINDTSSSDISQGSFVLPETVSIKTDDLVSFRVQGYYYGTNGFRFWIGSPTSGGCTPIELTPNVQEGREVGDYPEQIESLYVNQMSIGQDATTNAFDVTFTFKAGTTQNDTNGQFPNLTMKYVMDEGFINGLVITNIYYLGDGTIDDPVPTPEPEMTPAITVDGTIDELWDSVEYQDVSNFSATAGNTSAQAKVMWDEDYLYILANVTDDQIDASSENAWTRDGIEIFLDEDNSGE